MTDHPGRSQGFVDTASSNVPLTARTSKEEICVRS